MVVEVEAHTHIMVLQAELPLLPSCCCCQFRLLLSPALLLSSEAAFFSNQPRERLLLHRRSAKYVKDKKAEPTQHKFSLKWLNSTMGSRRLATTCCQSSKLEKEDHTL